MKKLTNQSIRKGVFAASAVALALSSGFAQALPVTEWGYSTTAVLSNATWETTGTGTTIDNLTVFSWGQPNGTFNAPSPATNARSALTVGNVALGTLEGGGPATSAQLGRSVALGYDANVSGNEIGRGTSFTHWNNSISADYITLTGGVITDTISLFPIVDPSTGVYNTFPEIGGPELTFNFKFLETTNRPSDRICADGQVWTDCPDLFGFQGTSVTNLSFVYDTYTYYIQFLTLKANSDVDTIGIGTLADGECRALGLGVGCFGFRTLEGQSTTERFGFAITSAPISVPEPGSLALLGLGLFGIGRIMRRKTAA